MIARWLAVQILVRLAFFDPLLALAVSCGCYALFPSRRPVLLQALMHIARLYPVAAVAIGWVYRRMKKKQR